MVGTWRRPHLGKIGPWSPVAQPGFHFGGGGVRALGAGPQVLRAPRFSLSAASVGPRYLLHVHERGGGDTTAWRLAPNCA